MNQQFGPLLAGLAGWFAGLYRRPGVRAGIVCLLALTAAGPLLGLLWAATAPHLDVAASISGSENAFTTQADIDAIFGFICLGAGIAAGVLARLKAADGGWPVPVGLTVGGFAGSLLAGWIGHLIRSPGVLDKLPPNAGNYVIDLVDMRVRATGLYLVLPVVALLVLALSLWLPAPWPRGRGWGGTDELVAEPGAPAEPDAVFAAASAFQPPPLPFADDEPPAPATDGGVSATDGGAPAGAGPNGAASHGAAPNGSGRTGASAAGPADPRCPPADTTVASGDAVTRDPDC
ncbi:MULTISPECIES: hypothetical protein [Pseudofrankia]|uniref:hypothetical protein n=1 Tax=Pseudofrankia TaxID=2994363 RepID=UPI000234CBC2|nr:MULTISPECIES: hypothetical protein [Pseudofrankia]OHV40595.1 hypothetical protein BCD49_08525 [Pseudofrankia sp. EUN1h]